MAHDSAYRSEGEAATDWVAASLSRYSAGTQTKALGAPMATGIVEFLSTAGKVVATTWRHGSRFLLSIACAGGAAAALLWLAAHFGMPKADGFWEEYGLILIIVAVVSAILAAFKYYAEQQNRPIVLIADEEQSLWHHAAQPDGKVFTQFLLRFHVTNMADGGLHLSKVRLNWPWIGRKRIVSSMVVTQHPNPKENVVSSYFAVRPHGRQQCSANMMVIGTVGGAGEAPTDESKHQRSGSYGAVAQSDISRLA